MVPAKKFGVKVTQYFVGFGKTLWSTKRGDTEYGVKMFPLGGFIRMIGMLPPEKRDANGKVKGFTGGVLGKLIADARAVEYEHVTAEDDDRLFYKKAWWKKVIVMSGGPMMNVFLAVIILGSVFMLLGVSKPTLTVSQVSDCVQPANAAAAVCRRRTPAPRRVRPASAPATRSCRSTARAMTSWDQFSGVIRDSARQADQRRRRARRPAGHPARRPDGQHAALPRRPDQVRAGRLPRRLARPGARAAELRLRPLDHGQLHQGDRRGAGPHAEPAVGRGEGGRRRSRTATRPAR